MWHGRRTYFAFFYFLLEIIHRNIGPDIPAEINQDGINPFHAIKMCGKIIVMLYLCSILLSLSPRFFHKLIGQTNPVILGNETTWALKLPVAPPNLAVKGILINCQLFFQSFRKYHDFFTQTGRSCRLPMCTSQHGNIHPLFGQNALTPG